MNTTIKLDKNEINFITKVGFYRAQEMSDVANTKAYAHVPGDLTDRQNHCLGVMCEYAAGKYLGLDMMHCGPEVWTPFLLKEHMSQYKGVPDINGKIEIRRVNARTNPIAMRVKDKAAGALIVSGFVDFSIADDGKIRAPQEVELLGWADSVADWDRADIPFWDSSARVLSEKRGMDSLEVNINA